MIKVTHNELTRKLRPYRGKLFTMFGHGSKNQFRYMRDLKRTVKDVLKSVPQGSAFLYYGDAVNKNKPDMGYAFQLISDMRKDVDIYMIQVKKAEKYGVPSFVKAVYWHTDYTEECVWGGLYRGKPCSNTKKWVQIHKAIGIERAFILGGGQITLDEYSIMKKMEMNYDYYPIERRYLGDGATKVKDVDSKSKRVGVTYHKIKE